MGSPGGCLVALVDEVPDLRAPCTTSAPQPLLVLFNHARSIQVNRYLSSHVDSSSDLSYAGTITTSVTDDVRSEDEDGDEDDAQDTKED